jgi:type 1 glutamine amidotransferase
MNVFSLSIKKALALLVCSALSVFCLNSNSSAQNSVEPIEILMITGGGPWHDYEVQKDQIRDGLKERLSNIDMTIDYEGRNTNTMESTNFKFSRHLKENWAADFDVVIYNHCNLQLKDEEYVHGIIDEHVEHQVPAVMLHCPIHLYQYAEGDAPEDWWNFTGAVSHVHEKNNHPNTPPYTIQVLRPDHPIMKNYPHTWRTPKGELYLIEELHDNATPLSHAYSVETHSFHETAWTHEHEGVRVFTSSLGHHNESMGADVNMNLIASGTLWAAGKLQEDGAPAPGYEGERGLGWISLWDDEGTLNGWIESGGAMNWEAPPWYSGETVWPTVDSTSAGKSFRLQGNDTLVVEGEPRSLIYDGRVAGGYFKNFEFKVDVYTYPGSSSGIYFHTRYEEHGTPDVGYEAQINASRDGESKTGSLVGVREVNSSPHEDREWFTYHVKVDRKEITVKVDGEVVNEYTRSSDAEGRGNSDWGTIGFQSSGGDSRVYFRDPMIRLWSD